MLLPQGETLEAVAAQFAWDIPADYNIARWTCDAWAQSEPDRVALRQWRDGQETLDTSYGELAELSNRLANALAGLGCGPGERVGIILPQSVATVVSHLAIYKSALIAVPLARLFAAEAIEYRLATAGVCTVITNGDGLEKIRAIRHRLPALKHVIVTDGAPADDAIDWRKALEDASPHWSAPATGPDTPALIIFTSGTTGPPKGALHGHRVVPGHLPGVQYYNDGMPRPGDMAWTPADWAWAGGLLNVLLPCLQLGVPVVHGGLERFDPEMAFRLMAQTGVANAFIPPTALRLMKSVERPAERYDLRLRSVGSGGESLGREAYEWAKAELGVTINEFYGQTECNLVLSSSATLGVSRAGAIGKPVPGHTVAALRPDGSICECGERGEVAILSPDPVMFLGYWRDEEATRQKFSGDWLLTGDQCVVDEDGYFHFVGRDDDIINSAGYRVGPGEIEDCLASHPAVLLSAAVGKPDALRTETVKAYVVLAKGFVASEALANDIKQHVKARLAANIYPREIEFVEEIPLTTTGKVIRRVFRQRARDEAEGQP